MVVIPMKPAPDDVDEAVAMFELVQELNETPERAGRHIEAVLVLTMVKAGTVIARSVHRDFEAAGLPLLLSEIKERVVYPEAAIRGLAPSMIAPEGDAAQEIERLAVEIERRGEQKHVKAA